VTASGSRVLGIAERAPWEGTRGQWLELADTLVAGATSYMSQDCSGIELPGPPSRHGTASDAMEGFARAFLLFAFRHAGDPLTSDPRMAQLFARGLVAGVGDVSQGAPGTWLQPGPYSHAIVESASVATALRLTREVIWDRLRANEQDAIAQWLAGCALAPRSDNNWRWFGATVASCLAALGRPMERADELSVSAWMTWQDWHHGGGWFSDGPRSTFDYYSAWAFQYYPLLLAHLDGDAERLEQVRPLATQFASTFPSLFAADGAPVYFGRSLTYRFASTSALAAAAMVDALPYPASEARTLSSRIVGYFLARGAVTDQGIVPRGWHGADDTVAQSYSGPAASYWVAKSFANLLMPADHPYWEGADGVPSVANAVVLGKTGLLVASGASRDVVRLANHGSRNPLRGANNRDATADALYGGIEYSSAAAPVASRSLRSGAFTLAANGKVYTRANVRFQAAGADWVASTFDMVSTSGSQPTRGRRPQRRAHGMTISRGSWMVHVLRVPPGEHADRVEFAGQPVPAADSATTRTGHRSAAVASGGGMVSLVVALGAKANPHIERIAAPTPFAEEHQLPAVGVRRAQGARPWVAVASLSAYSPADAIPQLLQGAPSLTWIDADSAVLAWPDHSEETIVFADGFRLLGDPNVQLSHPLERSMMEEGPTAEAPVRRRSFRAWRRVRGRIARAPGRVAFVAATAFGAFALASALGALLLPARAAGFAVMAALAIVVALIAGIVAWRHRLDVVPHLSPHDRLLAHYGRRLGGRQAVSLSDVLTTTRTRSGREIIGFYATRMRADYASLMSALELYRDPDRRAYAERTLALMGRTRAADLARVLFTQRLHPHDLVNARTIYEWLIAKRSLRSLRPADQRAYIEVLLATGDRAAARRAIDHANPDLPWIEWLRADAHHPAAEGMDPALADAWLSEVNRPFAQAGLEPLAIAPGEGDAFSRLTSFAPPASSSPSKISVIMPSYRPTDLIMTAARSVLASTWSNLELLVVDDASGPEWAAVYEGVTALDPRVRVIKLEHNGGPYRARNAALDEASGEFVTFHDADDWMHPRRLEIQARQLLGNLDAIGNTTRSVRVTARLEFSHHRVLEPKICEPSLMFRRRAALERVGYFDEVRKAADVEYRQRLEAAFGVRVPVSGRAPLTIQLLSGDSLSASDVRRSWIHIDRRAYYACARAWHATAASGEKLYIGRGDDRRAFHAPSRVEGRRPTTDFDVIFASHWLESGMHGGTQRSNEEEVRAAAAAGLKVGITHLDALWLMTKVRPGLSPRAAALLNEGVAEFVSLDEDAFAKLVVVRFPPTLQFAQSDRARLRTDRVIVLDNQGPYEADGRGLRYTVGEVTQHAFDVFGQWPTWVPQGALVRAILERQLPPDQLAPFSMPGLLRPEDWVVQRAPREGRRPVIGRYSRDALDKWPSSRREIMQAYTSRHFDTHVMGAGKMIAKNFSAMRPMPATWTAWRFGAVPTRSFLEGIDFFVHFDHPGRSEAFGRSMVEAMASKAVVILPEKFRPAFGDAAMYAQPRDVERIVMDLYRDEEAYAAQQARGYDFAVRECGYEAYAAKLRWLMGDESEWLGS
jgi:glycosyltransferase involved in cell wall biosynthesis